jgi:hypothetical protein
VNESRIAEIAGRTAADILAEHQQYSVEWSWCTICETAEWPCDAVLMARQLSSMTERAERAEGLFVESLRSPRNSIGLLALPKGRMEWAVEEAWDKATSSVGDPEDGIEMHDLSILADAICNALAKSLSRDEEMK